METLNLEFGRPGTSAQAWIRIPDRSHPDYKIVGSPHEHCAHLREFIIGFLGSWVIGEAGNLTLEQRMAPLETDDLRLLFQVNSFYRNLDSAFTVDHACIGEGKPNPWVLFLPSGDDNYLWWQITTLLPDCKFGGFRLYCIEMNDEYRPDTKDKSRFNAHSKFELVFAKEKEIRLLKRDLARFN